MDKETLIKKWLNHELTETELEAFKKLEDYEHLYKLENAIGKFKAPNFNSDEAYLMVKQELKAKKTKTSLLSNPFLRVAALLLICFGIYHYITASETKITTNYAEKTNYKLPDNSQVTLNAKSTISFNPKSWDESRQLELDGEAYFKVTKGSTFTVKTTNGEVTVLGTQFNVKQRESLFEVTCYEGSVKVVSQNMTRILKPDDYFLILDGKYIAKEKELAKSPFWINNESHFESVPYSYVLAEFERQYDVSFKMSEIDKKAFFTGSFTHNDMNLALKAITIPLDIDYTIKNRTITLSRE